MKAKSTVSILTYTESKTDQENAELFENYLPLLCNRYQCSQQVVVKKAFLKDEVFTKPSKSETTRARRITIQPIHRKSKDDFKEDDDDAAPTAFAISDPVVNENLVVVNSIYDLSNNLVEVKFAKRSKIPRLLVKIIGLIAPKYPKFSKISFKNSIIDCYTIHELQKSLPSINLTDVCLDGCAIREANYPILLDAKSRLQNLSLCRCMIDDEICEQIAKKLCHLSPAENSLVLLNLTSNHISDIGAKHLGTALRSNRHLRSLNLADNRITDNGAVYILSMLTEFPLTHDEIVNKRTRCIEYLRARQAIYLKYLNELCPNSGDDLMKNLRQNKKRKPSLLSLKAKANTKRDTKTAGDTTAAKIILIINQILGPYDEPFIDANLVKKEGYPYCIGNMVLCHLNLSYNNLSYISLKKLTTILLYQNVVKSASGLVKVVIEGNNLPNDCQEMNLINQIFKNAMSRYQFVNRRFSEMSRRRSVTSRITK